MRIPFRLLPLLLVTTALGSGCDLLSKDDDADRGRIVPGVSVDRVPLGADTLVVRSLIGPPNAVERVASSIIYRYSRGEHAGFSIHFGLDPNRRPDGTTSFALASPYSGQTADGIGLGSARSAVLESMGTPHFSNAGSSGLLHERYQTTGAQTAFLYDQDERVTSITMSNSQ